MGELSQKEFKKIKWRGNVPVIPYHEVVFVKMKCNDVLGTIPPDLKQLDYVIKHYKGMYKMNDEEAEESADISEETIEVVKKGGMYIFRRGDFGCFYVPYGVIRGMIEEAIKTAELSRTITMPDRKFSTVPRRIYLLKDYPEHFPFCPVKVDGELKLLTVDKDGKYHYESGDLLITQADDVIPRPVRGRYGSVINFHEKLNTAVLVFYLVYPERCKNITKYLDELFEVLYHHTGLGSGRAHGYGEIIELDYEKIVFKD